MSLELDDKIALVTGSSKGLGKAIAIRLAEKGVRVAVNYNTSPDAAGEVVKAITDAGGSAIAVKADVSNLDQVVAMVKHVEEELGAVEILVNNAGIINDQLLMRMSDEAWQQVIDINLNGTFYCTRAVLRNMVRARWGRIINIGSVVGMRGNPAQTNYSASKAAIMGFTKALAKEVATRNITANVVTPGYFETETTAILTDEKAKYITGQVISVDGGMAV